MSVLDPGAPTCRNDGAANNGDLVDLVRQRTNSLLARQLRVRRFLGLEQTAAHEELEHPPTHSFLDSGHVGFGQSERLVEMYAPCGVLLKDAVEHATDDLYSWHQQLHINPLFPWHLIDIFLVNHGGGYALFTGL